MVGDTYYGDKNRHICNIVEADEELAEDEDCRHEDVIDPSKPVDDPENPPMLNFAILRSRGDQFICALDSNMLPPDYVVNEDKSDPPVDPNTPETQKEMPGAMPFFDMFDTRKRYRDELTEAEHEIPSFDVTRHERCLSCGTLGIDKFICKSKLKIWTGNITKREKNGLA